MQIEQNNWKNNWEKLMFKVILIFISFFLIFKLYQLNNKRKENAISTHSEPNKSLILSDNAFEYLDPIETQIHEKSPFNFKKVINDPRRSRRTYHGASYRVKRTKPKKRVIPKLFAYLTYAGWIKNSNSKVFAIIIYEDIKSQKITRFTGLAINDTFKSLSITTINKESLLIKNNLGMTIRIPIHKRSKVRIK
jgi:hypothetical protein